MKPLTLEEYLPLARRTLMEFASDREKLGYLVTGMLGEWNEFRQDECVAEAGDVLWYVDQVIDEIESSNPPWHVMSAEAYIDPYDYPCSWPERLKKAVWHGSDSHLGRVLATARYMRRQIAKFAHDWGGNDCTIGHIRAENIAKLRKRHPNGWTNE